MPYETEDDRIEALYFELIESFNKEPPTVQKKADLWAIHPDDVKQLKREIAQSSLRKDLLNKKYSNGSHLWVCGHKVVQTSSVPRGTVRPLQFVGIKNEG